MPLVTARYQEGLPQALPQADVNAPRPTALDTVAAAFRQNNIVSSLYDRVTTDTPDAEPQAGYNVLDDIGGYEQFWRRFIEAESPTETQQIKSRIDAELRDKQTINDAGGWGLTASIAAGALDPATLASFALPVVRGASVPGVVTRMVGQQVAVDTASELAFHAFQETREVSQSLINVGAGAILTGVLGGVAARTPKGEFDAARKMIDAELNAAGSTVGAASARVATTIEQETIAGVGDVIAKTIGKISPLSRLMTSKSKAARQIAQDMAEVPYVLTKNEQGIATASSVETLVKRYDAVVAKWSLTLDDGYRSYAKRLREAGQTPIKFREFRDAVSAAMRRGDKSVIPEAAQIAQRGRAEVIEPLKKELQGTGLLEDPVKKDQERLVEQAVDSYLRVQTRQLYADYSARVLAAVKTGAQDAGDAFAAATSAAGVRKTRATALDSARSMLREEAGKATTTKERARARQTFKELKSGIIMSAKAALERLAPASKKQFLTRARKVNATGQADVDPAVNAMADLLRKRVSGTLRDVVTPKKTRVQDIETVGAQSYLPRLYNVVKIKNNRKAWDDALVNWFTREGADPVEALAAANEVTRTILGTTRGFVDLQPNVVVKAGPLKDRTLRVPDAILEPFLVNDVEKLLTQYIRTVAPQLELTRRFGEMDMKQAIQNLKDEYDQLMAKATSDKAKKALEEGLASDFGDIMGIRDRLLGKAGIPADPDSVVVRGAKLFRNYNYVRLLGSQTLSSLADAGRVVTQYGLTRTAKALGTFATNLSAWKGAREDAKRMGIGLDWTLNTRGATLGDIGDYAETTAEEIAQRSANMFTRLTGMATWNSSVKFLASALQQDEILRIAVKGNASARKKAQLASIGIDDDLMRKIAKQYETHGVDEGLLRARTELWKDNEAALAFETAILRAADTAVLTKGVGDTPLFMSSWQGQTLFQFKSFGMAAVNRLLIPAAQGIQRGDLAMMNGLAVMLALGVMRYGARQWTSDSQIETDPPTLIREAIDGAGLTSYLMDGYDIFAGMTGLPRASRYTDRSWIETAAGPTAGTITELGRTVEDLRKDGVSERDIHKLRKLMPGQNIFYLRRLINWMENETGEALGVPEEGT